MTLSLTLLNSKMGLKWFRARLSMKQEASKIPTMTGLYRKVSYFEPDVSTIQKDNVSAAPTSIVDDSTISISNKEAQHHLKADLISQSSTLPINSEEHNNHPIENTELSTSTKDVNMKKQFLIPNKQLNKTNQSDIQNMKPGADNEIVI